MNRLRAALILGLTLVASLVLLGQKNNANNASDAKSSGTTITLDGERLRVYFNDGDSFRILEGSRKATRVRIAGYNTLESQGPVHRWGDFKREELFFIAKEAIENARRGGWTCASNGENDGYDRLLVRCDDLAVDQIEKGLAHAMTVTAEPASDALLSAQHRAMRERKGMWAKGVPEFVLTSVHSAEEGAKDPTNRLVSTADGHSELWHHHDAYETCEEVCRNAPSEEVACMVYVPFSEWYEKPRPSCLLGDPQAPSLEASDSPSKANVAGCSR